jgi:hypothetical protein
MLDVALQMANSMAVSEGALRKDMAVLQVGTVPQHLLMIPAMQSTSSTKAQLGTMAEGCLMCAAERGGGDAADAGGDAGPLR